jgi:hypothetical protein
MTYRSQLPPPFNKVKPSPSAIPVATPSANPGTSPNRGLDHSAIPTPKTNTYTSPYAEWNWMHSRASTLGDGAISSHPPQRPDQSTYQPHY